MGMQIDFSEMDDVRAQLRKDHRLVHTDSAALTTPDTGVPTMPGIGPGAAATGDAGSSFVKAIQTDANKLATWLSKRAAAVHTVILDFEAIDGHEGSRYDTISRQLAKKHITTAEELDRKLGGRHSKLVGEEGGY